MKYNLIIMCKPKDTVAVTLMDTNTGKGTIETCSNNYKIYSSNIQIQTTTITDAVKIMELGKYYSKKKILKALNGEQI